MLTTMVEANRFRNCPTGRSTSSTLTFHTKSVETASPKESESHNRQGTNGKMFTKSKLQDTAGDEVGFKQYWKYPT